MSDRYTPEPDKYRKNSPTGPGQEYTPTEASWYEFTSPSGATTHIVYVQEDGSHYFPEGVQVCDSADFLLATSRGRAWKLGREDQVRADERAKRPDREQINELREAWVQWSTWKREPTCGRVQAEEEFDKRFSSLALEPEAREVTDAESKARKVLDDLREWIEENRPINCGMFNDGSDDDASALLKIIRRADA